MKILHLISSGGMYGAEAVILNMMRVLRAGPHTSALGVFHHLPQPRAQLHERAVAESFETHAIQCSGPLDRTVPAAIRDLVHRTDADVVHAHGYKADVYLYLAQRGLRIPLVSTCHTWYDNDLALRLYGALDRFVLRKYARVCAVSEQVRQRLLASGVRQERVAIIRNGIDMRSFAHIEHAPNDGILRVGLVGRLEQEKGVDLFLRSAAEVLCKLPHTQFVVVGEGPDREKLQALIEELGIAANASLLGREEDMPSFYASLDLLVSSSRLEGLPLALLEGMASGLPIVAAAVGAIPDTLQDNVSGILVPAEDVPALATAIFQILLDARTRLRLGTAARSLVAEEFSAERMTADYLRLYEQAARANH